MAIKESEFRNPVNYLNFQKFKIPIKERVYFAALWQKTVSFKGRFYWTYDQQKNELGINQNTADRLNRYFEKLGVLFVITEKITKNGGRVTRNKTYQLNFTALTKAETLNKLFHEKHTHEALTTFANEAEKIGYWSKDEQIGKQITKQKKRSDIYGTGRKPRDSRAVIAEADEIIEAVFRRYEAPYQNE